MKIQKNHKVGLTIALSTITNSACAASEVIQKTPNLPSANVWSVFLVLTFIIALILAAAFIFRKINNLQFKKNNILQLITGLSLGTRERVVLIQAGEKQILVGISPGRLQTLHVFDEAITNADEESSTGFLQHLKVAMERGSN